MISLNLFQDKRFVMIDEYAHEQDFFDTESENIYIASYEHADKGIMFIQEITPESGGYAYHYAKYSRWYKWIHTLEKKFNEICENIPAGILSNNILSDTGTTYLLDLTTEENYKVAKEYVLEKFSVVIERKYAGEKIIINFDTNAESCCILGNIDEYFDYARKNLEDYLKKVQTRKAKREEPRDRKVNKKIEKL